MGSELEWGLGRLVIGGLDGIRVWGWGWIRARVRVMVGVGIRLVRNDVSGTGEEGAVVAGAQRRGKRWVWYRRLA